MILANPLIFNARNICFKEIHFIYKDQSYLDDYLYLHLKSNSLNPYKTKTNTNGSLYFYADEGYFCFTSTPKNCCYSDNSFTLPPQSNIPTEIKLPYYCTRGLNLF